jgi:hypothetical protein
MAHEPRISRDQAKRLIVRWFITGNTWKPREDFTGDEGTDQAQIEAVNFPPLEGGEVPDLVTPTSDGT